MCRKILVVDDNKNNLEVFRRLLSRRGYELFETQNDLEAHLVATECQPGLILMSMKRPTIGRMISLCSLRRNPDTRHVPIVAITGKTLVEEVKDTVGFGFNDFLPLPFDETKLFEVVDRHFPEGMIITGKDYLEH